MARKKAGPSAAERKNARQVVKGYKASDFERPSVTADMVILCPRTSGSGKAAATKRLEVLLIQRGKPPYEGFWATPGGFVDMDEDLPDGAKRELQEETLIDADQAGLHIENFGVYGKPGRDPRTRVITIAWVALIAEGLLPDKPQAADDARNAGWFPVAKRQRPEMAFDHDTILDDALTYVRRAIMHTALAKPLLPATFNARQLREAYESLGVKQTGAALTRALLRDQVIRRVGKKAPATYAFRDVYWK